MDKTAHLPRRARVTGKRVLCPTGTVYLSFEILDGETFAFEPGQFVAIDMNHPEFGYKRSPYCIASPVSRPERFDLLVSIIPDGPVSVFLSSSPVTLSASAVQPGASSNSGKKRK